MSPFTDMDVVGGELVPAQLRDMDDFSLQSHRASDTAMLPVVSVLASDQQKRYSAVGARWHVANLQRAIQQLSVRTTT